jgi:cytochrome c oxidase assembly factor CtaG
MGEGRGAYRILVGRPEGKRTLWRRRRKDNIEMDLKEVGWAWTGLIWLRIGTGGGACESGNEPFCFHKMRGIFWLA